VPKFIFPARPTKGRATGMELPFSCPQREAISRPEHQGQPIPGDPQMPLTCFLAYEEQNRWVKPAAQLTGSQGLYKIPCSPSPWKIPR
jgi:hypothetical protein